MMASATLSANLSRSAQPERVVMGCLWWVGLLAVIASVAANLLVGTAAVAVFGISPEFLPLAWGHLPC